MKNPDLFKVEVERRQNRKFSIHFPNIGCRYEGVLPGRGDVDFYMEGINAYSHVDVIEIGDHCLGSGFELNIPQSDDEETMLSSVKSELLERITHALERFPIQSPEAQYRFFV